MTLRAMLNQPVQLALLAAAAVLAALTLLAYFRAARPRRGTTEWMEKLNSQQFRPLTVQPLRFADAAWAVLCALCAAGLRFFYLFFTLRIYNRPEPAQMLAAAANYLLVHLVSGALTAAALYLLLRALFGKPLPAFCAAVACALVQSHSVWAGAALAISLLCLYFWLCAPAEAPLFFHAFWLLFAGGFYGIALLCRWYTAWLAPVYLAAYVYAQVYRWRHGDPDRRGGKLVRSLILTALAFAVGSVGLWALYVAHTDCMQGGVALLRSFAFYKAMLPTLLQKLRALYVPLHLRSTVLRGDAVLFLLGAASLLCVAHGALKRRDSRCLMILLLQLPFVLLWLLGGTYLLPVSLLLAVGWVWKTFAARGKGAYVLCSAGAVALCYGALSFLQ